MSGYIQVKVTATSVDSTYICYIANVCGCSEHDIYEYTLRLSVAWFGKFFVLCISILSFIMACVNRNAILYSTVLILSINQPLTDQI